MASAGAPGGRTGAPDWSRGCRGAGRDRDVVGFAQSDELVDSVSQAVDDITDRLEDEPFNLSLDRTQDLQSSLSDSWREASGYAASGVQAGVGLLAGLVLAIAILYFILRDGAAFWQWILRRFPGGGAAHCRPAGERAWDVLGGLRPRDSPDCGD